MTAGRLSKWYSNIEGVYREQVKFCKEKNRELEERVENLLRVNRELKESLE